MATRRLKGLEHIVEGLAEFGWLVLAGWAFSAFLALCTAPLWVVIWFVTAR